MVDVVRALARRSQPATARPKDKIATALRGDGYRPAAVSLPNENAVLSLRFGSGGIN
jgi:hypothetical protein